MRLGSDSGLFAFGIDGVGLNSIDNGLVEVSEEILVSGDGSDIAFPHSQTRMTRQPCAFSSASLRMSRAMLRSIFVSQYSAFDFGNRKYLHPS